MISYISLFEAKQIGIIYHYTKLYNTISILEEGLKGNQKRTTMFNNPKFFKTFSKSLNGLYSYSFTRDKNFIMSTRQRNHFGTVRFTLDGNNMSNKYRFFPISEFADYSKKQTSRSINDQVETEERILSKDPYINLNKYILLITIYEKSDLNSDTLNRIQLSCNKHNIKLELSD